MGIVLPTFLAFVLTACSGASETAQFDAAISPAAPANPTIGTLGNSALKFDPGTYEFGSVAVSGSPAAANITVTNTSALPIYITKLDGSGDPDFSLISSTCPVGSPALSPADTCTVRVQFQPLTGGVLNFVLKSQFGVNAGDTNLNSQVQLVGTGIAPIHFNGILPMDLSLLTTTTASVSWTPAFGVSSYVITETPNGGTSLIAGRVASDQTSFALTGLTPATTYTFKVNAIDVLGGPDANTVTQTITTDALGTFGPIPPLAASENIPITSPDIGGRTVRTQKGTTLLSWPLQLNRMLPLSARS